MSILRDLDGASFGAYKRLHGSWRIDADTTLFIDRVQSDPFASPSHARIRVLTDIDASLIDDSAGRAATGDYFTRRFATEIKNYSFSGKKEEGAIFIDTPGQEVLERAATRITDSYIEFRIEIALPARGRRIRGYAAEKLLYEALPDITHSALWDIDSSTLRKHVALFRDQENLRSQLSDKKLVAFIGDGSLLARAAGNSSLPLEGGVPFSSPDSLRTEFSLPSGRTVTGMGIPEGITVIIGGGFHGKSTVLRALEHGVYNHCAGDGREWAITRSDACSIRAEDGRPITGTDISPFINNLPSGTDTTFFSTTNASGSTSQAASLMESLESGCRCLLIDEDTSATNFMIRDERMRAIVPVDKEPITPFIDRIQLLSHNYGISTVLVAGGSGDFFQVADFVIMLDSYTPVDVTPTVSQLYHTESAHPAPSAESSHSLRTSPTVYASPTYSSPPQRIFSLPAPRYLVSGGLSTTDKYGKNGVRAPKVQGLSTIINGHSTIDMGALSQLVHPSQTQAIARIIRILKENNDTDTPLVTQVETLIAQAREKGVSSLVSSATVQPRGKNHSRGRQQNDKYPGRLALPRVAEVMAAINRYRGLKVTQVPAMP